MRVRTKAVKLFRSLYLANRKIKAAASNRNISMYLVFTGTFPTKCYRFIRDIVYINLPSTLHYQDK
jgi:hypothetical protein